METTKIGKTIAITLSQIPRQHFGACKEFVPGGVVKNSCDHDFVFFAMESVCGYDNGCYDGCYGQPPPTAPRNLNVESW